jgi:hypothetical protein
MATPALIVGLGGTGVKVLTLVKQDLLATHGGRVPEEVQLLAFDTEVESDVQAGVAAASTALGAAGVVKLEKEKGEYIWIGGNVRDYVRDVARGKYPHVSSWLQAAYYLDTLPDALFYLEAGAGMLRQFGRLAIFYDVLKGAGLSKIYRMIRQALERVQRAKKGEAIQVILVSSVAGGTGAGMFVDIAYLIRQIARLELRASVTLRGFLVMPEAFSTIPTGITRDMRARAYAAMRENKRFMVEPDWTDGYPMYYHGTERRGDGDDVWQGHVKSKVFDFLYHIDGRREKERLDTIPLELGVAPTIADTISALLDEEGGRTFTQHQVNLNNAVQNAARTAFYGTVGTYTLVLPMYHITEDFAHRLTLEVLDELLGVKEGHGERDRDGVPIRLPTDRNAEVGLGRSGRDDALPFLDRDLVRSLQDATVEVQATPLFREVGRVAAQATPDTRDHIRGELAGRDLATWMQFFEPPYAELEATRREVQAIIQRKVEDVVLTSDKLREKPVDGLRRIEEGVKAYKAQHLGAEREGGRREGGDFRRALEKYREAHLETFRRMLTIHASNILNGRSAEDFREARGGKIGYLLDFLDGLSKQLDAFLVLMEEARDLREGRGERTSAMEGARSALEKMKQQASSVIPGRAVGAQRAYLKAEQYLVDILRNEIMEQLVIETVRGMREYTQMARDQVQVWANALGIGRASLYAAIQEGRKQVASNRETAEQVKARRLIRDPQYEEELYTEYARVRADRVNEMLRDLVWQTEVKTVGTRRQFALSLSAMTHEDDRAVSRPLSPDDRKKNVEALLGRAREAFTEAWKRESVLKYLRRKYEDPSRLGNELYEHSGPLLLVEHVPEGQRMVPANYLRAAYGEDPGEVGYLTDVIRSVANLSGADERFATIIRAADRFKCSLIYTLDLIPIEGTRSYIDAEGDYLRWQGTGALARSGREILHLFPAEVNAVKYEQRAVAEFHMPPFLLDDKVVLQLENIERFKLFASCLVFGLIDIGSEEGESGRPQNYWRLRLPEERGRELFEVSPAQEIYLTLAGEGTPSLLEAVDTFNYIHKDKRAESPRAEIQVERPIDYERVLRALQAARAEKAQRRLNEGIEIEPSILASMEGKSPEVQERAKRLLAERAYIAERKDVLLGRYKDSKILQERHLGICLDLALTDEIRSLEVAVRELLR